MNDKQCPLPCAGRGKDAANWDVIEVPTSYPSEHGGVHPSAWTKHRPRCSPTRSSHVIACTHTLLDNQRVQGTPWSTRLSVRRRWPRGRSSSTCMHAIHSPVAQRPQVPRRSLPPLPWAGGLGRKGHRCDRPTTTLSVPTDLAPQNKKHIPRTVPLHVPTASGKVVARPSATHACSQRG